MGSSSGVRHGAGEPGTASAERVTGPRRIEFSAGCLPARLHLSDPERYTLAEIGKRLGVSSDRAAPQPEPKAIRDLRS